MSPETKKILAQYKPEIFDVKTIDEAKAIILTPEDGYSPEQRWMKETPLLAEDVSKALKLSAGSLVLDFGCGVGRIAKELIGKNGGAVLGVDISNSMRSLAHQYVERPEFSCTSRNGLIALVRHGLQVDHAYVVWVLQHSAEPEQDIELLWSAIKPGGSLLVVNTKNRVVPTDKGWSNDGKNITRLLEERFKTYREITLTPGAITEKVRKKAECRLYKKRH